MSFFRGEVYEVCLDPVFGREIGGFKLRPVLIVSINDINDRTRVVTVIPGTSTPRPGSDFRNIVTVEPDNTNGLRKPTHFQCHQIRAIERGRFTARPLGCLSRSDFARIEKALAFCMGLSTP